MFKTLEEAIAAYTTLKSAHDALETSVTSLTNKNAELLNEKKAAVTKATAAEARVAEITTDLETVRGELATKTTGTDTVVNSLKSQHKRDMDAKDATIADLNGRVQKLLVTDGLKASLTEAGVPAHFQKAAEAMLASGAKVEADGDTFKVMIGDKPLAEAVKAWAASDEGKHFVVSNNGGGGAAGGSKVKGYEGKNPYAKETINKTEQGKLERENPDLAAQLKAEAGVPSKKAA